LHPSLMSRLGDREVACRQAILLGEVVQEADDRLAHRQRIATRQLVATGIDQLKLGDWQ